MGLYYNFFAAGKQLDRPVASVPYVDAFGLGLCFSVYCAQETIRLKDALRCSIKLHAEFKEGMSMKNWEKNLPQEKGRGKVHEIWRSRKKNSEKYKTENYVACENALSIRGKSDRNY